MNGAGKRSLISSMSDVRMSVSRSILFTHTHTMEYSTADTPLGELAKHPSSYRKDKSFSSMLASEKTSSRVSPAQTTVPLSLYTLSGERVQYSKHNFTCKKDCDGGGIGGGLPKSYPRRRVSQREKWMFREAGSLITQ